MHSLGLLGGTFDPIHYGHLAMAEDVRCRLNLAQVIFIPAGQQPLKRGIHCAPAADRLRMVQLAVADNPAFAVSDIEIRRDGPSYTIDTLRALAVIYPSAELKFIVGADTLASLHRWHRIDELIKLCSFVVVGRPGYSLDLAPIQTYLPLFRPEVVVGPVLDIAASAMRERVEQGAPIRYQVPDAVRAYIEEQRLYRDC